MSYLYTADFILISKLKSRSEAENLVLDYEVLPDPITAVDVESTARYNLVFYHRSPLPGAERL